MTSSLCGTVNTLMGVPNSSAQWRPYDHQPEMCVPTWGGAR